MVADDEDEEPAMSGQLAGLMLRSQLVTILSSRMFVDAEGRPLGAEA